MTTSQLSPCSSELTGSDLQALRDFALEAPYEWRVALEALVETAEFAQEDEDEQNDERYQLQTLREACQDAVKEVRTAVAAFLFKDRKFRMAVDETELNAAVEEALKDLEEAADPPEKPMPVQRYEPNPEVTAFADTSTPGAKS